MGIYAGSPQIPVMAVPRSAEEKLEFETSRRYDLSLKGWLGIAAIFVAVSAALALSRNRYWYLSVAIIATTVILFFWPLARSGSHGR